MTERLKRIPWLDAALPAFAVASVLALLFRLPTGVMDVLLAINLGLAATIFLSAFFISRPLDFSSFPTVLLTTTLYRLVLNVSTTRLILTQGNAGGVVDGFSRFVAGDNIVVGAVIFLIFIIIQFVVITKGATRISEVSARFALDALPGRQAAIDFDLNAGNITPEEARRARADLDASADFFGAMDGASKFVRGDAIAGLAIVFINVIGGLCVGVLQNGLSVSEACALYVKLTIGDGLSSQVPAFLISLAAGLIAARASGKQSVSKVATRQTFGRPIVLVGVGIFLLFLAFTGLPFAPLVTLSAGCFLLAWFLSGRKDASLGEAGREGAGETGASRGAKKEEDPDDVNPYLKVDPIEIAIGAGLVEVATPASGPNLLERVRRVRQTLARELGVVLPKARIRDDGELDERAFVIRFYGEPVYEGTVWPGMVLAAATPLAFDAPRGLKTTSPDGRDAYWIEETVESDARDLGYELLSAGDVVELALSSRARVEASTFLTRDATMRLLERLKESAPEVVEETLGTGSGDAVRDPGRLARAQSVLKLLLRENVSIRRLEDVLEALNDLTLREPDATAYRALEYVRTRLGRVVASSAVDEDGTLSVATLDPALEDALRSTLSTSENGETNFALSPERRDALAERLNECATTLQEEGAPIVFLVERKLRYALSTFAREIGLTCSVFSFDEAARSSATIRNAATAARP